MEHIRQISITSNYEKQDRNIDFLEKSEFCRSLSWKYIFF